MNKSETALKSVENIVNDHVKELDCIERRVNKNETQHKNVDSLVEDKLKFYATETSIHEQLSKVRSTLDTLTQHPSSTKELESLGMCD